jgi:hypothetical protein
MQSETHDLKTWPDEWFAVATGLKRFDARKADRHYKVGDTLRLHEWLPEHEKYTGRVVNVEVLYMLPGGGSLALSRGMSSCPSSGSLANRKGAGHGYRRYGIGVETASSR